MSDNQCDGCKRKLQLKNGIHYDSLENGGWPNMSCTKEKYNPQKDVEFCPFRKECDPSDCLCL